MKRFQGDQKERRRKEVIYPVMISESDLSAMSSTLVCPLTSPFLSLSLSHCDLFNYIFNVHWIMLLLVINSHSLGRMFSFQYMNSSLLVFSVGEKSTETIEYLDYLFWLAFLFLKKTKYIFRFFPSSSSSPSSSSLSSTSRLRILVTTYSSVSWNLFRITHTGDGRAGRRSHGFG